MATELADAVGATVEFTEATRSLYDLAEARFGPNAPHLTAMRCIEDENQLVLHHLSRTPSVDHERTTS